jgi:hypothetical protein
MVSKKLGTSLNISSDGLYMAGGCETCRKGFRSSRISGSDVARYALMRMAPIIIKGGPTIDFNISVSSRNRTAR